MCENESYKYNPGNAPGLSYVYMLHTGERLWARDYPFYPSFKDNPFPYLIICSKEFYQTGKT